MKNIADSFSLTFIRKPLLSLMILLVAPVLVQAQEGDVPNDIERAALQAFYNSTNGAEWRENVRWEQEDIDNYPNSTLSGITIANGDITRLNINNFNLQGTLPQEINNLTQLQFLSITYNSGITGEVPDWSSLVNLTYMHLNNLRFSDDFPQWIGALTNLQSLYMIDTGLTGKLPGDISKLTKLQVLNLNQNNLSAANAIPASFSLLDRLVNLSLTQCSLTDVSFEQGAMTGLQSLNQLYLDNNSNLKTANGMFPDVLSDLPSLWFISMRNMGLTKLPVNFGNLSVSSLNLSNNDLSNENTFITILGVLDDLALLSDFNLTSCQIVNLPDEIGNLAGLKSLNLSSNPNINIHSIGGLTRIPDFRILNLSRCNLITLSDDFQDLDSLKTLNLGRNKLKLLPHELTEIPSLENLNLIYNGIESIPDWFGSEKMVSLKELFLNNNLIEFPFSDNFYLMVNIKLLSLAVNNLKGTIPEKFNNFTKLEFLLLTSNQLESPFPYLGNLVKLRKLWIQNNLFSGAFPNFLIPDNLIHSIQEPVEVFISFNSFNMIKTMPANSNLHFENNNFTFEQILKQNTSSIIYAPQDSVDFKRIIRVLPGEDHTFVANVDREAEGCVYQWYRKAENNSITALEVGPEATLTSVSLSDLAAEYYYTIKHPDAPALTLTSRIQKITEYYCPDSIPIDFTSQNILCAIKLKPDISSFFPDGDVIAYQWNLGDGSTSRLKTPIYTYNAPGEYTVDLTILYTYEGCDTLRTNISKVITYAPSDVPEYDEIVVEANTTRLQEVIAANAGTFSDSWPLSAENTALNNLHGLQNASMGVWRNEGMHQVKKERKRSVPIDISTDGTFEMDMFHWATASHDVVPDWIQPTEITQYNSYGFETENQDILGVYSAELYGYFGQLPIASGVNLEQKEMAFSSFESTDFLTEGNLSFGPNNRPVYKRFKVTLSLGHMARVLASPEELEGTEIVDVSSRYFDLFSDRSGTKYLYNNKIVCRAYDEAYSEVAGRDVTLLVLEDYPGNFWTGTIQTKYTPQNIQNAVIDVTHSHSGEGSLEVTNEAQSIFRQEFLSLKKDKAYMVSLWVSVKDISADTPVPKDGVGVTFSLKDKYNEVKANYFFQPSGNVIEGWQKITGIITAPEANLTLEIAFKKGEAPTAWFDDLRLQPERANMKSFVYDLENYQLKAILDEENYATLYFYDKEGKLYLVKKETVEGIKTISENIEHQVNYSHYKENVK